MFAFIHQRWTEGDEVLRFVRLVVHDSQTRLGHLVSSSRSRYSTSPSPYCSTTLCRSYLGAGARVDATADCEADLGPRGALDRVAWRNMGAGAGVDTASHGQVYMGPGRTMDSVAWRDMGADCTVDGVARCDVGAGGRMDSAADIATG